MKTWAEIQFRFVKLEINCGTAFILNVLTLYELVVEIMLTISFIFQVLCLLCLIIKNYVKQCTAEYIFCYISSRPADPP